MADALLRLVAHPPAVVADVLGKAFRSFPLIAEVRLLPRLRVHRRQTGELRWDLDECLGDQHRHGV